MSNPKINTGFTEYLPREIPENHLIIVQQKLEKKEKIIPVNVLLVGKVVITGITREPKYSDSICKWVLTPEFTGLCPPLTKDDQAQQCYET